MTTNQDRQKRDSLILKQINRGDSYRNIADTFKITRERVRQIGSAHNIERRKDNNKKDKLLYKQILLDLKGDISIEYLEKKYSLDRSKLEHCFSKLSKTTISKILRRKRDEAILSKFNKGVTATIIAKSQSKALYNPIKNVEGIYRINKLHGIKRFPKVGNRSQGGCFENKRVLKIIAKEYDKNKLCFESIADKLNSLGYKTVTNMAFERENVRVKYHAYKKKINQS